MQQRAGGELEQARAELEAARAAMEEGRRVHRNDKAALEELRKAEQAAAGQVKRLTRERAQLLERMQREKTRAARWGDTAGEYLGDLLEDIRALCAEHVPAYNLRGVTFSQLEKLASDARRDDAAIAAVTARLEALGE